MPSPADPTRRAFLTGAAATLATPAISQVKGPFDALGPGADPDDLIDRVWDPGSRVFLSIRELIDRLVDAPVILLGERHGYAAHQDREAFLIQALADRGRYPALALEMLEPRQEVIVRAYRRRNPEYARRLGIALDWASTGWPDWSFYEPVFDAAFAAKLPILGADLPLARQRVIEAEGTPDRPEDPWILDSWKDAMFKAHCGLIDNTRTRHLALKQWKRDQAMASAIQGHARGAILIAGQEHVRADRGVPRYVSEDVVSIAFEPTPTEGRGWLSWGVQAKEKAGGLC